MGKYGKRVEFFVTALVLFGVGFIFFFMNRSVGSVSVLRFSLLQIMQGAEILVLGILLVYRTYLDAKAESASALVELPISEDTDKNEKKTDTSNSADEQDAKDAADSFNATIALMAVATLVVGYYFFTMQPPQGGAGIGPLHLVVCVVSFIAFACVERWWSMQLEAEKDAVSICNLMVIDKIAVAAVLADLLFTYSGVAQITRWVNYGITALWFYTAAMILISAAIKLLRHNRETAFRFYVVLPVYQGSGKSGVVTWLEQNTGISMRSLWSIDYIRKKLPAGALGVIMIVWLSTCLVEVEAYEQGALYRFGRLTEDDILKPGLHFKLPVPFETVKVYNTEQARWMIIGYEGDVTSKNNLWTRPHEGEEQTLLLGNGKELVAINLKVTYKISDLYQYLTSYASPESVLNAKGYEVVMNKTIGTDIDTLISGDRSVVSHEIEQSLREYAQEVGLGLEITSVNLASIHPPVAIASVYQEVVNARIQKGTMTLTAEGEALVANEGAEADKQIAINDAEISKKDRVSTANAEVKEYNAGIEAYEIDPDAYYLDKYLETIEKALKGIKKYLVDSSIDTSSLYLNFNGSTIQGQVLGDASAAQDTSGGN